MKSIKKNINISKYGEVFTDKREINSMVDLVSDELKRPDSRFLEPACGDGAFLVKILEKKMDYICERYKKNSFELQNMFLLALSSVYGIEIQENNVSKCRKNIYNLFKKKSEKIITNNNDNYFENAMFIIEKNIVCGDALTMKDSNNNDIILSQWSMVKIGFFKRVEYKFRTLFNYKEKIEDLDFINDNSLIPQPIFEHKICNFLRIKEDD